MSPTSPARRSPTCSGRSIQVSRRRRPAFDVDKVAGDALVAVQPETTIPRAVLALLNLLPTPAGVDPIDDVLAAPRFPAPLARELIRLAPDFVVPGLDEVPMDRVFGLVTNPPFVHAVLAGANHEMMRELRWRGYPTDERGTTFHRFWRDDADELPDLHTIRTGGLGNAVSGGAQRHRRRGAQRAPGPVPGHARLCRPRHHERHAGLREAAAARVPRRGSRPTSRTSASRSPPTRRPAAAAASSSSRSLRPRPRSAWTRRAPSAAFPRKASELAWTNTPLTGAFVKAARPGSRPFNDNGATWGANAADLAASTYQQPVRAAIHFRELLG